MNCSYAFKNIFRIFDIAFFIPGMTFLLLSSMYGLMEIDSVVNSSTMFIIPLILVFASYVLGLCIHSFSRIILFFIRPLLSKIGLNFSGLRLNYFDNDTDLNNIILYLWNTSSVCINIGTVFIIMFFMVKYDIKLKNLFHVQKSFLILIFGAMLWFSGIGFRRKVNKILDEKDRLEE